MLASVLLLAVAIGLVLFSLMQMVRLTGERFKSDVVSHVRAAEIILEQRHMPEEWLAPYRAKIDTLRKSGKSEQEIAASGLKARQQCLHKIDELMSFFRRVKVTDRPDTQKAILRRLQSRRDEWAAAPWQEIFAAPPSPAAGIDHSAQQAPRT